MHVQYIGECSVHRRDTLSTSGGGVHEYTEYTGGCSVNRRDTKMHVKGYHDACEGIS